MAKQAQTANGVDETNSFVATVKFFYGVLISLAITNAISEFAKQLEAKSLYIFPSNPELWFTLFVSITMLLRFYFGNIAHLDSDKDYDKFEITFDALVIITQAILLSYATFQLAKAGVFFPIIICVIVLDLIWFGVRFGYNKYAAKRSDIDHRIGVSQWLSLATVVLYIIFAAEGLGAILKPIEANITALFWIFGINTSVDLVINFPRYVGFEWRLMHNDK